MCAKDVFPEGTADEVHFEHAAKHEWVLVTNDEDHKVLGHRWLREGKMFAGLIEWAPKKYEQATIGDLVKMFEALAEQDEPFDPDYPIIHL